MVGVIFGHARSGTSELTRAVSDATGQDFRMEPFHRPMRNKGITFESPEFPAFFDEVMSNKPIVKHLWNGLTEEQNLRILSHKNISGIVMIYRKDAKQAALSKAVANSSKKWSGKLKRMPKNLSSKRMKKDVRVFKRGRKAYAKWVKNCGLPHLIVSYEELYTEDDKKRKDYLLQACQVLGLEVVDLEKGAERLSPVHRYNSDEFYRQASWWNRLKRQMGAG